MESGLDRCGLKPYTETWHRFARSRPKIADMILYITLILCATLAGLLVYRYDLYDREPWMLVLLMAATGAGAMWVVGLLEGVTLRLVPPTTIPKIALIAATHEEAARLLIVGLLAVVAPRHFNDPMDGIIYGSIAGLGMAVAESVNHLSFLPDKPSALPATEVVRLLGHLVLGGISCYGIGLMRVDARDARKILLIAVSFAVTWHFVWDWIAFSSWSFGAVVLWQKGAAVVLMVTGIFVYGACVASGSRRSRDQFAPGDPRQVWGWPLTLFQR
jgi:RsiW-degrading membrane proteinase PrsW (M82 family)